MLIIIVHIVGVGARREEAKKGFCPKARGTHQVKNNINKGCNYI
jgi:hypothetical protein